MSFWLNVTAKARDDITRNAAWWAEHHSLDVALRWYDEIYKQLDTLLTFPERHAVAPENDEFEYEIREKPVGVGSHPTYRAIFYDRRIGSSSAGSTSRFTRHGDAGRPAVI